MNKRQNANLPLAGIVINKVGSLDAFHGTNLPTEVAALVPTFQFLVTNPVATALDCSIREGMRKRDIMSG